MREAGRHAGRGPQPGALAPVLPVEPNLGGGDAALRLLSTLTALGSPRHHARRAAHRVVPPAGAETERLIQDRPAWRFGICAARQAVLSCPAMRIRLSDLNEPQRQAVVTTEGPLLVLAGAGSGKTRVITYRVAHMLEKGVRPENVLAVSFTNKAADEMRERVERICPPAQARKVTMCTFHALGLQILKQERAALGMPDGFTIYDTADQLGVLREILRSAHLESRKFDVKAILSRISRLKNAGTSPEAFVAQLRKARFVSDYDGFAAELYPRYLERMRSLHALDFDDLLVETLRLLTHNEEVQKRWQTRFRYLMIDEYQDTNRCQLDLLRVLCAGHGNLAVVGDDDQSIYGWRGAESKNILEFAQQFPGAQVIKLEENYRSTGNVLAAANAVIEKNTKRHGKTLWTSRGGGDPITLVTCPDEHAEAKFIAEEISLLLAKRKDLALRDIAVLFRASAQAEAIEEAFREERVDYRLIGGQAFFERKEVKDALAYLKLLCYPHDEISLRRVINYPPRGLGVQAMERLAAAHQAVRKKRRDASLWDVMCALSRAHKAAEAEAAPGGDTKTLDLFGGGAKAAAPAAAPAPVETAAMPEISAAGDDVLGPRALGALQRFVDMVQHYRAALRETKGAGLRQLLEQYTTDAGIPDDLTRHSPSVTMAQIRHKNLSNFLDSVQRYADRTGAEFDMLSYLNRLSISAQEEDTDDGLRDEVTLSTLHGSKGLEFRVVFLIGVEEEILPHKRSLYPSEMDFTLASVPDGGSVKDQPADIDEERRLCYVGITRAREVLYISWCQTRRGRGELRSQSRFLGDIPPEVLRLRDLEGPAPSSQDDAQSEEALARASLDFLKQLTQDA